MRMMCCDGSLSEIYSHMQGAPTIWQILMQESVRSHHLLFSDFPGIDETSLNKASFEGPYVKQASICFERLLYMSDLKAMRAVISELSVPAIAALFSLYLRCVDVWRRELASSLN